MTITKNISTSFRTILAFMLASFIFVSCSKNHDDTHITPVPAVGIEGKWSGFKGNDKEVPDNDIIFNIKAGGVIEELNAAGLVKGTGTWTLVGDVFTAHYQFKAPLLTVYTYKATYDKVNGKLIDGIWGFDDSDWDGGMWYSNKLP